MGFHIDLEFVSNFFGKVVKTYKGSKGGQIYMEDPLCN